LYTAQKSNSQYATLLLLTRYVMLWPRPLTHLPWTFTVYRLSCSQTLYQVLAKLDNPAEL